MPRLSEITELFHDVVVVMDDHWHAFSDSSRAEKLGEGMTTDGMFFDIGLSEGGTVLRCTIERGVFGIRRIPPIYLFVEGWIVKMDVFRSVSNYWACKRIFGSAKNPSNTSFGSSQSSTLLTV
jgi:hypothetical protein